MVHRSSTIRRRSSVFQHPPVMTSQTRNDVIDIQAKMSGPTAVFFWSVVVVTITTSVYLIGPLSPMSVVMTTIFVTVAGFACYCRLLGNGCQEEELKRRRRSQVRRLSSHMEFPGRRTSSLVQFWENSCWKYRCGWLSSYKSFHQKFE